MISKALKRTEDGELVFNVDAPAFQNYTRSRSKLPKAATEYIWFDVDKPVEKEQFDKTVNRMCHCMLCVMGTILTVGFIIIVTVVIMNKR